MAAAGAQQLGDETSFVIVPNQAQDDTHVALSQHPAGRTEAGKIYIEARVDDDFTGDFVQVGCGSESSKSQLTLFVSSCVTISYIPFLLK